MLHPVGACNRHGRTTPSQYVGKVKNIFVNLQQWHRDLIQNLFPRNSAPTIEQFDCSLLFKVWQSHRGTRREICRHNRFYRRSIVYNISQ